MGLTGHGSAEPAPAPEVDAATLDGSGDAVEDEVLRSIGRRARTTNLSRARRLGELLDHEPAGRLTDQARGEAEVLAHQIVGSAGTFGYRTVSALAVEVEHYLARRDEDPGRATRARAVVAELVQQLSG